MTNTLRVDLSYRPLRIGWAIREGDIDSMRKAMRYSHALWGGRFNPILIVDREDDASRMVERYRLDMIFPIGDSFEVTEFSKKFPHLIQPFPGHAIFVKGDAWRSYSYVLDIHNAISYFYEKQEWKEFKESGLRAYQWRKSDLLADVFLVLFGGFPAVDDIGTDYVEMIAQAVDPEIIDILPEGSLPTGITQHPNYASFGRLGIERTYLMPAGWDMPGFFLGSADDMDDIVTYWNIRACDIPLLFVDLRCLDRYVGLLSEWYREIQGLVGNYRNDWDRRLAAWSRHEILDLPTVLTTMQLWHCTVDKNFWVSETVSPPVMQFGQTSTLGVLGESNGLPRVNFSLADKPYSDESNFGNQHLAASVSFVGGLYGDHQHTLEIPYIPELNEFYARAMHFRYNMLRVEPGRIGLVIDVAEHDSFLTALPVADLIQNIFKMAGFESKLSNSGRIVRQLLTQLGGLQGGRVFKIPGARQLLKSYGPRDTFSLDMARNVIVGKSSEHKAGTFSPHANLYLGSRERGTKLTPQDVFTFMVDKGLFRIGVDLDCPRCIMSSWVALDVLRQDAICELCGHKHDATRQLIDSGWRFRRSGVLGSERNAQGAVPVALALQQLDTTLDGAFQRNMHSPSLDLKPINNEALPKCEVDFVWLAGGRLLERTEVLIAECKDQGPISPEDFQRDVENFRRVADAFPLRRFEIFLLFVKLAPFTPDEVRMASTLNAKDQHRVILLTARELEPYHIFERIEKTHDFDGYSGTLKALAHATTRMYFRSAPDYGAGDEGDDNG